MFYVLLSDRTKYMPIEFYDSMIWTERYCGYGDFKMIVPYSDLIVKYLDYYAYMYDEYNNDVLMFIESVEYNSDDEGDRTVTISGRSLESVLDRRVIDNPYSPKDIKLDEVLRTISYYSLGSIRDIPNLNFDWTKPANLSEWPKVTDSFKPGSTYDIFVDVLSRYDLGYKMTFDPTLTVTDFNFSIINGDTRKLVTFSKNYDNLFNSRYLKSEEKMKNAIQVLATDSSGNVVAFTSNPTIKGLNRREGLLDASNAIKEANYNNSSEFAGAARDAGVVEANKKENRRTRIIDGEVTTEIMYEYKKDFFLGDIVKINTEFGVSAKARITEYTKSYSSEGYSEYPTFEIIDE